MSRISRIASEVAKQFTAGQLPGGVDRGIFGMGVVGSINTITLPMEPKVEFTTSGWDEDSFKVRSVNVSVKSPHKSMSIKEVMEDMTRGNDVCAQKLRHMSIETMMTDPEYVEAFRRFAENMSSVIIMPENEGQELGEMEIPVKVRVSGSMVSVSVPSLGEITKMIESFTEEYLLKHQEEYYDTEEYDYSHA